MGKWIRRVGGALQRAARRVRDQHAALCELRLQATREIELEVDKMMQRQHRDVDSGLCAPIPADKQSLAPAWQFYPPCSAKQTASKIYRRILHQLMV